MFNSPPAQNTQSSEGSNTENAEKPETVYKVIISGTETQKPGGGQGLTWPDPEQLKVSY